MTLYFLLEDVYMSNEEIVQAIQQQEIDKAAGMEQLYKQNKGVLYKMAKKYAVYAEIEDLLQEAYFGLYEAVMRYDVNVDIKFTSYAVNWIKQALTRYIENNGTTIRIPVYRYNQLIRFCKVVEQYKREYNREPKKWEVANTLQFSPEQVEQLQKDYAYMRTKSLDTAVAGLDNEEITIIDTIPSDVDVENMVLDQMLDKQFKDEFWGLIEEKLDKGENDVIVQRYRNNHTMAELPRILTQDAKKSKTPSYYRTVEQKALRKLKYSNLKRVLKDRYEIAITKAYRGSIWSEDMLYSATERAAFKDLGIRI